MSTTSFPIDLRNLLRPYKGEWVALSSDEKKAIGHGKTMDDAISSAKMLKPHEKPVLIKVPDEGVGFVII